MSATWIMLSAWIFFAGTHLALGLPPLRTTLAARLGEQRFVALFSAVAALSLALLAWAVASLGNQGGAGPALGERPVFRVVLAVIAWGGLTLAIAGLLNYMRSPMALFRTQLHAPAGIERVTRHAFFVGFALFAAAHALLAATMVSCLHFAGFALFAGVGAWLQDRKLVLRHGAPYIDYLAQTSLLPFLAVLQGRQRLRRGEGLPRRLLLSAALALLMLATHPLWSSANGAGLAGMMAFGGVLAFARRWRHARPKRAAPAAVE